MEYSFNQNFCTTVLGGRGEGRKSKWMVGKKEKISSKTINQNIMTKTVKVFLTAKL